MRFPLTKPGKRHDGQSIVELALCMPLLLILLLGTVDVGRVFFNYIELRNAVVEGATYGSRNPDDTAGIWNAVTDHGIPAGTVIISSQVGDCTNPSGGGSVTVVATNTFTPIFFATLSNVASSVDWSIDVQASSTIRCMT